MKKAIARKNLALIVSIIVSITLVGGIPMIPIGFATDYIFVAIAGIVFVAHGFYGVTFYWIWFAGLCTTVKVVKAIEKSNLYTVREISLYTSINMDNVKKHVRKAMNKGWLVGLLFDGNNIYANENEPIIRNGVKVQCEYCDTFYMRSRNMNKCPCCGATVGEEIKD